MKKSFLLLCFALINFIGATATTTKPINSTTNGTDVWYFIKCSPRSSDANAKWLTGCSDDGSSVLTNTVISTDDDAQLWKVVTNKDGIAIVNKKFNTYINADQIPYPTVEIGQSIVKCVAQIPTTSLKLCDYVDQTVLPNGFYLVNTTAVEPISDANKASITFQFYSAGAGSLYRPINYGPNAPNIHSGIQFLTAKDILVAAIAEGKKVLATSSIGYNPGQVDPGVVEGLEITIEDAEFVLNDVNSTQADYITTAQDVKSIILQFKSSVNMPKLSVTGGPEYWYYIQGLRPENTYMTSMGVGMEILAKTVIPDDTQLWKMESNGSGFALKNKATGEYLNTDEPYNEVGNKLSTQATIPNNTLTFKVSNDVTNGNARFWIENTIGSTPQFRLHAGWSNVLNWTGNANDNSSWLLIDEAELFRTQFEETKKHAREVYNSSVEGVEFGQYSAEKRIALLSVIEAEEAKKPGDMSQEELKQAVKTINDALAIYEVNNKISDLSSITKTKWFRFVNAQSPAGYATGKAMTSHTRTLDHAYTYENVDTNSDAQLFRFELNDDETKATTIINKATGYHVGANGFIVSQATTDNFFEINQLDGSSFAIKPTTNYELHAAAYQSDIVNWPAGAGSASAWHIEFVKSEDVADLSSAYLTKRVQTRAKYEAVHLESGIEFGQYTSVSVDALNAVITAEETKDVTKLTQPELLDGINNMIKAIDGLEVNTKITSLVSNTPGIVKWYRLVNNMSNNGYATGKAMSSNGRIETEQYTWEDEDVNSDAQLFRFELTGDNTKIAHIVNKSLNSYVSATGSIEKQSTAGNEFEITQLEGGRSFWIDPTLIDTTDPDPANHYDISPLHAAEVGTDIVNWLSGAGSASAWIFKHVKDEVLSVKPIEMFNYKVRVTNRIITIEGVEQFEVYSALGQQQNYKAKLTPGVYVVKVNNAVKKVVVN